jgi:hypothetical protein
MQREQALLHLVQKLAANPLDVLHIQLFRGQLRSCAWT